MENQQQPSAIDSAFDEVVAIPAIGDDILNPPPRRTLTHLSVLAAVVLPITLLPYLAARRSTNLFRRQLEEQRVTIAELQRDLKVALLESGLRRDEHARVRGLLTEIRKESRNLGAEMKQDMQRLRFEGEQQVIDQGQTNNMLRSDLQKILDETRRTR